MLENHLLRKSLAVGISITAVIFLVLTSFSNVVGYQTVQTSQQNLIKERITQRELLFQTIVDIANNKELQRVILKSQMSRGIFPVSEFPTLTKNQLRQMYLVGLMLSKTIGKSRAHSLVQKSQVITPEIRKDINAVLEKDATLRDEINQLKNSDCDCENTSTTYWRFPVICSFLFPLYVFFFSLFLIFVVLVNLFPYIAFQLLSLFIFLPLIVINYIGVLLWCWWLPT
jgi:hypothetical protein